MKKRKRIIYIGLFGLGTVGTGVLKILKSKHATLQHKTGIDLRIKTICVKHPKKHRALELGSTRLTSKPSDILNDPEIDQVVELIGGIQPAYSILCKALNAGKDVISANKALFAEKGTELYRLSQKTKCHIGIEASVGGGMPVIKSLNESLTANHISAFFGILNGTCNAILTDMSHAGESFAAALEDAKKKGYAEADPRLDINGTDTAHKLAILLRIAFLREINFKSIYYTGIEKITSQDIEFANTMGYAIKLIATAKQQGHLLEAHVQPMLIHKTHALAKVNGVHNAVLIQGDEVGDILIFGKGAGQKPTASAVVGDIIDLGRLRQMQVAPHHAAYPKARLKPMPQVESRFYLRVQLKDEKGVLSRITRILGRHNISIASVHQVEQSTRRFVPVVLLTHVATLRDLKTAVRAIEALSVVRQRSVVIAVYT